MAIYEHMTLTELEHARTQALENLRLESTLANEPLAAVYGKMLAQINARIAAFSEMGSDSKLMVEDE